MWANVHANAASMRKPTPGWRRMGDGGDVIEGE